MTLLHSFLLIAQRLWEPFGVLLLLGLAIALWRNWRTRGPLFWFVAAFLAFALLWRSVVPGVTTSRYFAIFALPCIFFTTCVFLALRAINRKFALIALGVLIFCSVCKDLRFNPYERKLLNLYHEVREDAARFERPLLFSCSRFARSERWHVGIPSCAPDHIVGWEAILEGLQDNLDVYRDDFDAVYVFLELPNEAQDAEKRIRTLMPDGIEIIGSVWRNSRKKKRIVAFRYCPPRLAEDERIALRDAPRGELLPNGDFSKSLSPEKHAEVIEKRKKYLPRYRTEEAILPEGWGCGFSLFAESNAFMKILQRDECNVLHVEANDSYIAAMSAGIPHKESVVLSFFVHANRDSVLQISQRGDPIVVLPLEKGGERLLRIVLPKRKDSPPQTNVRFWLQTGDVDLWDVRWIPLSNARPAQNGNADAQPPSANGKPSPVKETDSSCESSIGFSDSIAQAA